MIEGCFLIVFVWVYFWEQTHAFFAAYVNYDEHHFCVMHKYTNDAQNCRWYQSKPKAAPVHQNHAILKRQQWPQQQ